MPGFKTAVVLPADPTSTLQAATKQYVDTGDGTKLALAGGTLTGALTLAADPTAALGAATKQYVDAHSSSAPSPVTLTDATTIATNASLGVLFRVTLGGNRTLGNPSSPTDGQRATWEIIQPASGGPYTITLGTSFGLGTDITSVVLSTAASKHDFLGAIYNSSTSKWYVTSLIRGF